MIATIKQAERNELRLSIVSKGHGHWKIECDYRGKVISTTTTNSTAVDDFRAELGEKDGRVNRRKRGYQELVNEIIRDNQE